MRAALTALVALSALSGGPAALAQQSDAELSKKLSNPVSDLISVPFQFNYDCCYGPTDGEQYLLNFQPVIPFSLNRQANLIVRTIVPFAYENDVIPGDDEFGFGDITQSFFYSPKSSGEITWGLGPVFLWPVGTQDLSGHKWGAGPTGVILRQKGPTTIGALVNQIWSYAGDDDFPDVNRTFLQPFFAYQLTPKTTLSLNSESTYDWEREQWIAPINLMGAHIVTFGDQRVQFQFGGRAYVETPDGGPDWGLRATATLLFPRK